MDPKISNDLPKISKSHTHKWWDKKGRKKQASCRCDTGVDHMTPKEDN